MVTEQGLVLFQRHPKAPFADGMYFSPRDSRAPWRPIVFIPEDMTEASCGYCGRIGRVIHYMTWLSCELHPQKRGEPHDFITIIRRTDRTDWNSIRPLLNMRSPYYSTIFTGGMNPAFVDMSKYTYDEGLRERQMIELLSMGTITHDEARRSLKL